LKLVCADTQLMMQLASLFRLLFDILFQPDTF